jgi:hypothetical protein
VAFAGNRILGNAVAAVINVVPAETATPTRTPSLTPTATPTSTVNPALTDHYVGYKIKASAIANNTFPLNWNLNLDDSQLANTDADDPENYLVNEEKTLLNPAMKNTEAVNDPHLHYLRYQIKEAAEGVGAAVNGTFPRAVKHVKRRWDLTNQFGSLVVMSTRVTSLWVPVAKSETSAPVPPGDATHYECYQIKPFGVLSDQTPETAPASGKFKFRKDLQAYFLDQFSDCVLNQAGTPSFAGTPVEGKCLFDLKKPREICNPVIKSAVDPPRTTDAIITGSTPSRTDSLVCYQMGLASKFNSLDAAALVGAPVGSSIIPKQVKHLKRQLKAGTQLYTTPGNGFPKPTQVDTSKGEMACIPSSVVSVVPLP